MKQKKFSQIYREAAESLFNDKFPKLGCSYHICFIEAEINPDADYNTDVQEYFNQLFLPTYFGEYENQDCINHRITALLLASEIARSEGL